MSPNASRPRTRTRLLSRTPQSRIRSIIRMQSKLFGSIDEGFAERGGYEELLDFDERPTRAKIGRVVSILRAQEEILSSPYFSGSGKASGAAAEIPELVAFALSLGRRESLTAAKSAILPVNLGRAFRAKGFGAPLFGDYRPSVPPSGTGAILVHREGGPGESAIVEAARLESGVRITYRGAGISMSGRGSWIACEVAGAESFVAPEGREMRAYRLYSLFLDKVPRDGSLGRAEADPYRYEYPYYFFDGCGLTRAIARFVAELFSALFHVPFREAEDAAELFAQRLP